MNSSVRATSITPYEQLSNFNSEFCAVAKDVLRAGLCNRMTCFQLPAVHSLTMPGSHYHSWTAQGVV
jgi:hypothetical protein